MDFGRGLMPCYHPVNVPINRHSVVSGQRIRYIQEVGCGKCRGCRAEQRRQWMIRIVHEASMHDSNYFVTLTYSDKELPENGAVNPAHFRQFIKDLRRGLASSAGKRGRRADAISYYGCGEYGERSQRPHYHAVLFNLEFLDCRPHADRGDAGVWQSASLEAVWKRGLSELGSVTEASAAYVAGYVNKKARDVETTYYNSETGEVLQAPFARMSNRPAIGNRWIRKWWRDVYPADRIVFNGQEMQPPRYYDKWMDQDHRANPDSPLYNPLCPCEEHREMMLEVREKRYEDMPDLDRYTLNAKEQAHIRRSEYYERRDAV